MPKKKIELTIDRDKAIGVLAEMEEYIFKTIYAENLTVHSVEYVTNAHASLCGMFETSVSDYAKENFKTAMAKAAKR